MFAVTVAAGADSDADAVASDDSGADSDAESDANSDGVLSKQEFVTFLGSTAHLDTFFKRADKDRSGDLSVADLAGFIDSILK